MPPGNALPPQLWKDRPPSEGQGRSAQTSTAKVVPLTSAVVNSASVLNNSIQSKWGLRLELIELSEKIR